MKSRLSLFCFFIFGIGTLIFCGCKSLPCASNVPRPPNSYTIVHQPETRVAQAGSYVVIAVTVHPERKATYQWFFNGARISGATDRQHFIERAAFTDVGAYSVEVKWPDAKKSVASDEAFLSVYKVTAAGGIAGTLTVPVKQFRPSSFRCPGDESVRLDREYTPGDSLGSSFFFYGPDVPLSDQPGPFKNWTHLSNLRINAIGGNNAGVATAIRLTKNSGTRPRDLSCESNGDSRTGPTITESSLATGKAPTKARYEVTIFYKQPPGPNGAIDLNWQYY